MSSSTISESGREYGNRNDGSPHGGGLHLGDDLLSWACHRSLPFSGVCHRGMSHFWWSTTARTGRLSPRRTSVPSVRPWGWTIGDLRWRRWSIHRSWAWARRQSTAQHRYRQPCRHPRVVAWLCRRYQWPFGYSSNRRSVHLSQVPEWRWSPGWSLTRSLWIHACSWKISRNPHLAYCWRGRVTKNKTPGQSATRQIYFNNLNYIVKF